MIYEDVNQFLRAEFPDFTLYDESDMDLPYVAAGHFTQYILEAYLSRSFLLYPSVSLLFSGKELLGFEETGSRHS